MNEKWLFRPAQQNRNYDASSTFSEYFNIYSEWGSTQQWVNVNNQFTNQLTICYMFLAVDCWRNKSKNRFFFPPKKNSFQALGDKTVD